jgi:hypothetical protein
MSTRLSKGDRVIETTTDTDTKALELRRKGRSYQFIARELGFKGVRGATEAFNRALRRQPKRTQATIRREERARLDGIWQRAQDNEALSADELERRRRGVEWHRAQLDAE